MDCLPVCSKLYTWEPYIEHFSELSCGSEQGQRHRCHKISTGSMSVFVAESQKQATEQTCAVFKAATTRARVARQSSMWTRRRLESFLRNSETGDESWGGAGTIWSQFHSGGHWAVVLVYWDSPSQEYSCNMRGFFQWQSTCLSHIMSALQPGPEMGPVTCAEQK